MSHWSISPIVMFIHQIILKRISKITRPWNIGHVNLHLFWGQSLGYTVSLSENMTLIHQIVLEIQGKITGPLKQNWQYKAKSLDHEATVTYIYFEVKCGSYWFIIPNNNVHTSNSLHDIRQNQWPMKSQWPTFILRSNDNPKVWCSYIK